MDISKMPAVSPAVAPTGRAGVATESVNVTARGNSWPVGGKSSLRSDKASEKNSASTVSVNDLHDLVRQANQAISMRSSKLKFTVSEGTDIPVVRVEDAQTGEVIRQIPSEEMVALSRAMKELTQGMILEEKV